jgi:hypothetical protein
MKYFLINSRREFMKFRIVFAGLCAVAATSSLMSMEQQGKESSNFLLNHNFEIKGYSQCALEPSEFVRKQITCVFPSDYKDVDGFYLGFVKAAARGETNEAVKFPSLLNQKNCVAKIIALKKAEERGLFFEGKYFVKLQEKAHVGENYTKYSSDYNVFVGHNNKRLNFLVNNKKCITGYSRQNMEFALKPSEFMGKNIIDLLHLDEKDHNAVVLGFSNAVEKEETVKVPYVLDAMDFVAKITALKMRDAEYNYFVKVQEVKK